jgi:cytochrome c-type biogenesis protein CcmH
VKSRLVAPFLLALATVAAASVVFAEEGPREAPEAAQATDDGAFVQGEKSVETRLLAPCCWNGTLDVHESDLARDLRREIRARLRGGESVDQVEESLVVRYGERVRATPKNERIGLLLGAGVGGVLLMAVMLLRKSVRTARPRTAPVAMPSVARDMWDERLDEEIERRRSLIS